MYVCVPIYIYTYLYVSTLLFLIYTYVGHGQYSVYTSSSKSSTVEECIIVFQAPAQFLKK